MGTNFFISLKPGQRLTAEDRDLLDQLRIFLTGVRLVPSGSTP